MTHSAERAAAPGDPERFELLYRQNFRAVLGYALARLDPERAMDLAAETFLVAWRRFSDVPDDPLPWLYGVARKVTAGQLRAVLELSRDGGPVVRVELGGADFFDLHHSAFFNSLPVARDGLLTEHAAAREYTVRFVRVPELTAEPVRQQYEPLGNRVVRYSSNGYQADITFDADGFVTLYQDYLERVG